MLSVLLRAEPATIGPAVEALRALPATGVVPLVNAALIAHPEWGTEAAWPTAQSLVYRGLVDLTFDFADSSSLETLETALLKTTNAELRSFLLQHIQQKAATKFAGGFRPALDALAQNGPASVQRSVLPVLVAIAPAPEKPAILNSFLGNRDSFTRAAACTVTAQAALPALTPQITDLVAHAQPGAERLACCRALQVLGVQDACPQ